MHYDPSNPHQHYTRDVSMSEVNMIVDYVNRLEFDYTEMQRELAEARKDAARYRWLRENGGQTWQETASQPAGIRPCIFMRVPALNDSGSFILRGEQADAAIDAAMASDPPAR